MPPLATQAIS